MSAESSGSGKTSPGNPKFEGFYRVLRKAQEDEVDVVMIHHPAVLGDNYEELVENLDRIAAAGVALSIVPPKDRS